MNKQIFAVALCAFLATTMHTKDNDILTFKPATSTKTGALTAGAGITAGGATLYGLSWLLSDVSEFGATVKVAGQAFLPFRWFSMLFRFKKEVTLSTDNPNIISGLITAAAISAGALAAWLVYRYQPEGRYGRAHDKLKSVINNAQLQDLIEAEQTLIENIDNGYIHHAYPRVSACNDFLRYHKSLEDAIGLFYAAIDGTEDPTLVKMARSCIDHAKQHMAHIKSCITIIRNEPDWVEQLKGYDAMLARQAQERAAIAQSQIAWNTWR